VKEEDKEEEFEEVKEVKKTFKGREFVVTKQMKPTSLNYYKVNTKVCNGIFKEGGMFSSNYITYTVISLPNNWDVKRKDSDFYFLRKSLTKQFPHILIPPLPIKKSNYSIKFI
jgi:hypothetical protein